MKYLTKDKKGKVVEDVADKCEELVNVFTEHLHNRYNRYCYGFFSCELLNLVIVICQFFLTDRFLGGHFLTYGSDVYQFYSLPAEEKTLLDIHNPMCEAFPRVSFLHLLFVRLESTYLTLLGD